MSLLYYQQREQQHDQHNPNNPSNPITIRPVMKRFPISRDTLDDTNLPFSCVVTPLLDDEYDIEDEDDNGIENDDNIENDVNDEEQQQKQIVNTTNIESLSKIPKCLHCGAPHSSSDTHKSYANATRGSSSTTLLLCYLCGKLSSTSFYDQEMKRMKQEGTLLAGSFVGSASRNAATTKKNKKKGSTVYELPLRLSSQQHQHQQSHKQPIFSVPAVCCPLLWFIVLDDSCINNSRMYWKTVSQLLSDTLADVPNNHVHVSILLARQRDVDDGNNTTTTSCSLGIYQLTSPIPHVKHIHCNNDNDNGLEATSPVIDEYDYYDNFNNDNSNRSRLVSSIIESLTEVSTTNKPRIQSACRSLYDYVPTIRQRQRRTSNNIKEYRCAMSWTIELILQALQTYGQPANGISSGFSQSQSQPFSSSLSYAGGKITCLLSSRPAISNVNVASTNTTSTNTNVTSNTTNNVGYGGFGGRIAPTGERYFFDSYSIDDDNDDVRIKRSTTTEEEEVDAGADDVDTERGLVAGGGGGGESNGQRRKQQQSKTTVVNGRSGNGTGQDGNNDDSIIDDDEEYDLTPCSLQEQYFSNSSSASSDTIVSYYDELGRLCAQSSIGVDILCLSTTLSSNNNEGNGTGNEQQQIAEEEDFALPLYGILSQKSGAPGPLIFYLSSSSQDDDDDDDNKESSFSLLKREFQSRAPWANNVVYGAELRLRLPPGYGVDDSSVERNSKEYGPQLAPLYADKGLLGPGSAVLESTNLWRFGCCDPWTTVTIDLMLQQRNIKTQLYVEGIGENVQMQPVIQTCFAYTTIIPDDDNIDDDNNNVQYRTVRQMRIHSIPVPFAKDTETLYASLDTGALSVVLFHKLALAALQDGYLEASMIAEDWLQSTLTSIYQSAEQHYNVATSNTSNGSIAYSDTATSKLPSFYANERLLLDHRQGVGGELSDEDVLLAQGHEKLRAIPLITYLLMQCDAFRPTPADPSCRSPSLDSRYSAMLQMMSMSPSIMTRCIGPRIQLWSSAKGEKEPILDAIDLSSGALRSVVGEFWENNDLLIVIDTPDQIAIIDGQYIGPVTTAVAGSGSPTSSSLPLVMGAALKRSILECAKRYRTRPNIVYELSYNDATSDRVIKILTDILTEDAPAPTGEHDNYFEWRADMANGVKEELENDSSDPLS